MRFLSNLIASTLGVFLAFGILFVFLMLFIVAVAASSDSAPSVPRGAVLAMKLGGAVPEINANDPVLEAFAGGVPADLLTITSALRKAAADERIAAVWLDMRGLRTGWATLQEIRQALEHYRASGKPLYASSQDFSMAEADYYLAGMADSVFAGPESFFEFNGFALTSEFYKGLLDKLEVEPQIVRAGRFKSAVEPYTRESLSAENREQLEAYVGDVQSEFLRAVAERRGKTPEAWKQLIDAGAVVTAEDARRAGLIDGILHRDQVEAVLRRRLGRDADAKLSYISLRQYGRVPAADAGIKTSAENEIAIVYAAGAIISGEGDLSPNPLFGGGAVGSLAFNKAMKQARDDKRVKAVVLRVNSPGGSASASDAMWREIHLTQQQKPVVVSMGDAAASGGYWIATAAPVIVADPLTITGSIGVFAMLFDTSEMFADKLGITFDVVRTGPYADMFSGVRPLSAGEQDALQRSVDGTYARFLSRVSEARKMPASRVDSLGQGRIWTGVRAKQHRLVDELGGLRVAVDRAARAASLSEGGYSLRVLPRPKTFMERLTANMEARLRDGYHRLTTTPAQRTLEAAVRALEQAAADHATVQARLPLTLDVR